MDRQIYIYLLNEGTDVWRPVEAEQVQGDIWRITSENDNEDDEQWQFRTGDCVRCRENIFQDGKKGMVAVEKVDIDTDLAEWERRKNFMALFELSFALPDWVCGYVGEGEVVFASVKQRMKFVIGASRENVRRGTGGPFAAGVFDSAGKLISLGVNIVEASNCSILHAEMVAIALAQKAVGRYDLSNGGKEEYELVTSTEPCAMCFGAVPWSGVSRLVCGARDEDARSIGFDEGPKLDNWVEALQQRGITVVTDILREQAAAVLQEYAEQGGKIYNAGA